MDKEVLEIIDSAVKIGLGTLIGSVTAIALSMINFHHNKSHRKNENTVEILKNISSKIGIANHMLDQAVHPFWREPHPGNKDSGSNAVNESLETLLSVNSNIIEVHSLAALIGDKHLSHSVNEASECINTIYSNISSLPHRSTSVVQETNDKINQAKGHLVRASEQIGIVFSHI